MRIVPPEWRAVVEITDKSARDLADNRYRSDKRTCRAPLVNRECVRFASRRDARRADRRAFQASLVPKLYRRFEFIEYIHDPRDKATLLLDKCRCRDDFQTETYSSAISEILRMLRNEL